MTEVFSLGNMKDDIINQTIHGDQELIILCMKGLSEDCNRNLISGGEKIKCRG